MSQNPSVTDLISALQFLAFSAGAILSFLSEHWGWFATNLNPGQKRLFVAAISAVAAVALSALVNFTTPDQMAHLNSVFTVLLNFALALAGALGFHYGLNKAAPAIVKRIASGTPEG